MCPRFMDSKLVSIARNRTLSFSSPSLTFECRACGWKHTVAGPVSDVRFAGVNHFDMCPRCGGNVESRRAGILESAGATAKKLLGRYR